MVKFYLNFIAELNNVTDLQPVDTPEEPFEYKFTIECTRCRTQHDKPITINRFESHELANSKGEVSFVVRCRECKSEHNAVITRTNKKFTSEDKKKVSFLEIDARGVDFLEFIPDGYFECVGTNSNTKFTEIDLTEGEWYDYDDKEGEEVSIVETRWDVSRS